jgi:8-oxo-dGTP pyrophosphatase MutT (NUDIX family)
MTNSAMTNSTIIPRLAATILLLRDRAEEMEVFMVVRHHEIDFASGALVFPGGSVDPEDGGIAERGHVDKTVDVDASAVTLRIAAIREAFEESGFLLARRAGSDGFVTAEELKDLQIRYRTALLSGETTFERMIVQENLTLATDALLPFAHWITPERVPKRFDTHFFLARVPSDHTSDHIGSHDGRETVESLWIRPGDALSQAASGRFTIVVATRLNLQKLGRNHTAAEALRGARNEPIFTVLPELVVSSEGDNRRRIRIPLEAGYRGTVFEV